MDYLYPVNLRDVYLVGFKATFVEHIFWTSDFIPVCRFSVWLIEMAADFLLRYTLLPMELFFQVLRTVLVSCAAVFSTDTTY